MSARRTWDKEFFEKKAKERLEHGDEYVDGEAKGGDARPKQQTREEFRPADANAAGPMGSQRAFLKAREANLDLEDKVGKVEIINPTGADGSRAGFWCEVCQCLLKDSAAYLDHINGKKRKLTLYQCVYALFMWCNGALLLFCRSTRPGLQHASGEG